MNAVTTVTAAVEDLRNSLNPNLTETNLVTDRLGVLLTERFPDGLVPNEPTKETLDFMNEFLEDEVWVNYFREEILLAGGNPDEVVDESIALATVLQEIRATSPDESIYLTVLNHATDLTKEEFEKRDSLTEVALAVVTAKVMNNLGHKE